MKVYRAVYQPYKMKVYRAVYQTTCIPRILKKLFMTSKCESSNNILKAKSQCNFFFFKFILFWVSAKKEHVCILLYSINFEQKVTGHFQKKINKMWIDCTKIASWRKYIIFKLKIHRHETCFCYYWHDTCLATV